MNPCPHCGTPMGVITYGQGIEYCSIRCLQNSGFEFWRLMFEIQMQGVVMRSQYMGYIRNSRTGQEMQIPDADEARQIVQAMNLQQRARTLLETIAAGQGNARKLAQEELRLWTS